MIKIVKDTEKSLRMPCVDVTLPLSAEDKATLDEMLQYLKDSQDEEFRKAHPEVREGVGLAAPQIGLNKKMLVVYYPVDDEGNYVMHQLVNPKIIVESIKKCYLPGGEGCLSVDKEHEGLIHRAYRIDVKAYEASTGEMVKITARGYDAIVLQHEIDHLSGILFYDHIDKNNPMQPLPGAVAV